MKLAQEEIREIIAEAKLVRETSLETAKLQLSEMYTPQIQAILSQRLKDDAEVIDEEVEEVDENKITAVSKSDESPAEADEVQDGAEPVKGDAEKDVKKDKKDIKEDTHIHVNNDEELQGEEGDAASNGSPDANADPTVDMASGVSQDVDPETPTSVKGGEQGDGQVADTADEASANTEDEGDDLDDILRELDMDDDSDETDGDGHEGEDSDIDVDDEEGDKGAVDSYEAGAPDKDKDKDDEDLEESVDLEATMKEIEGQELSELRDENTALNQQVEELSETVTVLRSTLQEINLLNAKLLFTNKLFKKYSLTEDQKAQIIIQLDRAKTLRETKLVYGTLAESFKAIPTVSKAKKADSTLVAVTEGIASKVTGSTKPVDVLTESATNKGEDIIPLSPLAERFQQLARINQPK